MKKKPVVLIIRDGWGISPQAKSDAFSPVSDEDRAIAEKEGNAPLLAEIPFHEHFYATYPRCKISASGEDVGLPDGQMGNSEVGHLNLGAGRIVYQDLARINRAIKDNSLFQNQTLLDLFQKLKANDKVLHLIGLVSDGGVHSHQDHALALVKMAHQCGVREIYLHALTDGRDTSPTGGIHYLKQVQDGLKEIGAGKIATLVGRYYAMDRDKRWDRTKLGYDLIMEGAGEFFPDPIAALQASYDAGVTDEFVKPVCFIKEPRPIVREGDGILFFNFRADRARQLSLAWLDEKFDGFARERGHVSMEYVTLTEYDVKYYELGAKVVFSPETLKRIMGEIVSEHGLKQLRLAETEKYPHVTYFFNGGNETPFEGEDRVIVPSPKVATYDLQPEMSALGVTDVMLEKLGQYDFIVLNFANPDMVGHTGVLSAAMKAVETVDACLKRIVEKILELDGRVLITADHGNCEWMIKADGSPHTAHTTNLVHLFYVGNDHQKVQLRDGILADISPTLLRLLQLPQPPEMTSKFLLDSN